MVNIVDILRSMPDYIGSHGRTEADIDEAEKALGISFAKDYREYLKDIGLACFDGHELTGLTNMARLDVVVVTKERRKQSGEVPASWYVVEEAGIDGIVVWQDSDGVVYETAFRSKGKKIAESLSEYIAG